MEGAITPYSQDEFLVELNITKIKEDINYHYIYPVSKGLVDMNFIKEESYYSPGSIGITENILRNQTNITNNENLLGFAIPKEQGQHRLKFTLRKSNDYEKNSEASIYYVHYETRFGKKMNWIKEVKLRIL